MLEKKEIESPIRPELSEDILDVSNFDPELVAVSQVQDRRISVR